MIFDTPEMEKLRRKYAGRSNCDAPRVVLLDRMPHWEEDRQYLEYIMRTAPLSADQQRDWVGRLVSVDEGQHWGVWFEMMLYGWLRELGAVQVGPRISGVTPDFALATPYGPVIIEARVHLMEKTERLYERYECHVYETLRQVERPYRVVIYEHELVGPVETANLRESVTAWLDSSPDQQFVYHQGNGNRLTLVANYVSGLPHVGVAGGGTTRGPDVTSLKRRLSEKAFRYNKTLRDIRYPYVIAILLEPWHLSSYDVVVAWLGRDTYTIEIGSGKLVRSGTDQSGLHYGGFEPRHRTVSGTLVFRVERDDGGRAMVTARYVQNPFAHVPLDAHLFPVESAFVVLEQDETGYTMGWQPKTSPSFPI